MYKILIMSIEKNKYQEILEDLDVGNSVAEFDSVLEFARIETPVFDGVLNNRYDIILGKKGAGKTAMFKIINLLNNLLLKERKLIILTGVNSKGESIFNEFKKDLAKFDEKNFETFWKFYFITLIYNDFIKNEKFSAGIEDCQKEIQSFIAECEKAGIPNIPAKQSKSEIIQWILGIFKKNKISSISADIKVDTETPTLFSINPKIDFAKDNATEVNDESKEAVYVQTIGKSLAKILQKSGFRIWIILDRLDEVFARYSAVEFNGLRGLLVAYKNFVIDGDSNLFRIKLFLRDDIVDFLTNDKIYKKHFRGKNIPPLPAATHIFAKQSPTLNWDEDEIEQLILNRLMLSSKLCDYLEVPDDLRGSNLKKILRASKDRKEFWNKIFPRTAASSPSLKWIFTRLKDANGIVTPRSVIDMLEGAINEQKKIMSVDFKDVEEILSINAIKKGLKIASINKLEKDIFNEFPQEQHAIKRLKAERKIKFTKEDFRNIYGKNWEETVASLNRIGIIRYVKDSDTYRVELLFRPALDLAYSS